jgi:ABC-2 type transport system ATP-binding protein
VTEPAVVVDDVSKRFRMYRERNQSLKAALMRGKRAKYDEFWALRDVSFEIPRGSTFGLVGENGSGKSTLLKCIANILRPDGGRITTTGKMAALLELGSGFHPELSGRENVYLNGSILGLSRRELDARFDAIVDFAGVAEFIDQPVKNYSSGMYVRLGFSVAINVDPDILLVDEVLAVGDAAFQAKCMEKFADLRNAGKTIVIVSHDSSVMRGMCDEVAWLEHGRLHSVGKPGEVVDEYVDETMAERSDHHTDEQGQDRWGTGEVQLDRLRVVGPAGVDTSRLRTGEPVTFRLEYTARHRVERPVFGLEIRSITGQHLWGDHSKTGSCVPDAIEGAGVMELAVPRLMLQPGSYEMAASVVDHSLLHTYDLQRSLARFDVERSDVRDTIGYLAVGGTWDHAPDRTPTATPTP